MIRSDPRRDAALARWKGIFPEESPALPPPPLRPRVAGRGEPRPAPTTRDPLAALFAAPAARD